MGSLHLDSDTNGHSSSRRSSLTDEGLQAQLLLEFNCESRDVNFQQETILRMSSEDSIPENTMSTCRPLLGPGPSHNDVVDRGLHFWNALSAGTFSDLKIICGPHHFWNAHKLIVCPQSTYLTGVLAFGPIADQVDLSDDDPEALGRVVEYLYVSRYMLKNVGPGLDYQIHVKVYSLAFKYHIESLMEHSKDLFIDAIRRCSSIDRFFESIHFVYSFQLDKVEALRESLVRMVKLELPRILRNDVVDKKFHDLTVELPSFHHDILHCLLEADKVIVLEPQPPLCEECGPSDEFYGPYRIECNQCGLERLYDFN